LPPLRPSDRPRLRTQQCADGVDLALSQGVFSRWGRQSWHIDRAAQKFRPSYMRSMASKSCGHPLGEGWPRANRSGTGRGGDVTGSRVRKSLCCYRSREDAVATAGRPSPSETHTLGSLCD
jgi:hypothetical protein